MAASYKSSHCVLLEEDSTPTDGAIDASLVIHWDRMDVPAGHVSLPVLIEKNGLELRTEYLSWIARIGRIMSPELILHDVDDDFSFWWFSLLAEKQPLKTAAIYRLFKIRMLEKLLNQHGMRSLELYSSDPILIEILSTWCLNRKIPIKVSCKNTWRKITNRFRIWPPPAPLHALIFFLRFLKRAFIAKGISGSRKQFLSSPNQVTVVSYVPNLDKEQANAGVFRSRYWGKFHSHLDNIDGVVNWVLLYAISEQASLSEIKRYRDKFRTAGNGHKTYFLLEEFLTIRNLYSAIRNAIAVAFRASHLKKKMASSEFHYDGSDLDFWPLFRDEWVRSFQGPHLLSGCLYYLMFKEMSKQLPQQKWCLFLWENQPWEHALTHVWKKYQKTTTIGHQHGAVPALDLRNFEDPSAYSDPMILAPTPDILVTNGEGVYQLMRTCGFPEKRLVIAEALRYSHLYDLISRNNVTSRNTPKHSCLLVVLDYAKPYTAFQLKLLAGAAKLGALDNFERVLIKPHPFAKAEPILKSLPHFRYEITHTPLAELWPEASVVYCATPTSSVIESLTLRIPTIISSSPHMLNLSAVYGILDYEFVSSPEQLKEQLLNPPKFSLPLNYFNLSEGIDKWREILSI